LWVVAAAFLLVVLPLLVLGMCLLLWETQR
jgi:hypothetical protein